MGIQYNVEKAFSDISIADKSKEATFKRNLLKLIISEFQRRPNLRKELTDEEAIKIINKFIKNNNELAKYDFENIENLEKENEYLETFLPHKITEKDIIDIIKELELIPNAGRMIGMVMGKIKSIGAIADGRLVKDVVIKYLEQNKV